jgi:hypothetical protein
MTLQHSLQIIVVAAGPPAAVFLGHSLRGRWIAARRLRWYVLVIPPALWFFATQSAVALCVAMVVCGFLSGFIEAEWSGGYRGSRSKIMLETYGGLISSMFVLGLSSLIILSVIEFLLPGTVHFYVLAGLAAAVAAAVVGMFHHRSLHGSEDPFRGRALR